MTPAADARRRYLADALARYWPAAQGAMLALPVPAAPTGAPEVLPPRPVAVPVPDWADDAGVDGMLLVPQQYVLAPHGVEPWRGVDWWGAAFWYLNGLAERAHEAAHGPVHSYSLRLNGWDARLWERAWVNRIAIFLRRWAARERGADADVMFGPLPDPRIVVTHDLDAVHKTIAIRFKQTAFHGFNALRLAARGRARDAARKLAAAARFLLTSPDYRHFDTIAAAERKHGLTSSFFVYGGVPGRRGPKAALFDPGYDVTAPDIAAALRGLADAGWQIGLHPSFDAWRDSACLAREKSRVERAIARPVTACRQHWLRFGWSTTWNAQQAAGLTLDATLGFNDRPGFRNGAALAFHPWDGGDTAPLALVALPMVLMDSHLYDYAQFDDGERRREMARWLDEIRATRGIATVLWHAHVLASDYGWQRGYDALLAMVAADRAH